MKKALGVLVIVTILFSILPASANAYKLFSWKISNPKDAHYFIQGPNKVFTNCRRL
jgi:hypothetical protein